MNAITSIQPALPSPKPLWEKALLTRLTEDGPTSNEVASTLLRAELDTLYPDLNIDLGRTVVGTPIWEFIDNELTCVDTQYTPLTYVLARLALESTTVNYLQGEHFLTQQPMAQPPFNCRSTSSRSPHCSMIWRRCFSSPSRSSNWRSGTPRGPACRAGMNWPTAWLPR